MLKSAVLAAQHWTSTSTLLPRHYNTNGGQSPIAAAVLFLFYRLYDGGTLQSVERSQLWEVVKVMLFSQRQNFEAYETNITIWLQFLKQLDKFKVTMI